MDILIESTKRFESDIQNLTERERDAVTKEINRCAEFFETRPDAFYHKLHRSYPLLGTLGAESSLYKLKASLNLRVILAVDNDPIFEQIIITLFRVVKRGDFEKAYEGVAESLYQDFINNKAGMAA